MKNTKNSALIEWQNGASTFSLYASRLVAKHHGFFGDKTSQYPVTMFQGVAIRNDEKQQLALYLVACERAQNVALAAIDECDILATWRMLAERTQLPLFIEHEDGTLLPAQKRFGALVVAKAQARRRGFATLENRRPRAPMRRKSFMMGLAQQA